MKKLINVLSAIEKDLRIIASNTETSHDRKALLTVIKGTPSTSKLHIPASKVSLTGKAFIPHDDL